MCENLYNALENLRSVHTFEADFDNKLLDIENDIETGLGNAETNLQQLRKLISGMNQKMKETLKLLEDSFDKLHLLNLLRPQLLNNLCKLI